MTVILSKNDTWYPAGDNCWICADTLSVPMVMWHGDREAIYICGACSGHLNVGLGNGLHSGLRADLIQVAAIHSIREAGRTKTVFKLVSQDEVDAEALAKKNQIEGGGNVSPMRKLTP